MWSRNSCQTKGGWRNEGQAPQPARARAEETLASLTKQRTILNVRKKKRRELYGALADEAALQHRYRKQLGQRLIAGIRDESGRREVMSNGKGRYFVLECCRDRQQLQSIRRRIQNQMRGLDASARKVQTRLRVLGRLAARLKPGKR